MSETTEEGQPEPGAARAERVAVIAIHGVADQKSGDTARAIASLMVNADTPQVRYSQGDCDSFIVAVPPLKAMAGNRSSKPLPRGSVRKVQPSSQAPDSLGKALEQSTRSDFLRDEWIVGSNAPHAPAVAPGGGASSGNRAPTPKKMIAADAGIAFSDYLLSKWKGADNDAYEATRIRMTRTASGAGAPPQQQQVDVHEMYWADLSRLSGALPRIVTELFTIVFRLSLLGRDAVDRASADASHREPTGQPPRRWAWLTNLQRGLDWAFSNLLANLFSQLLLIGLLVVAWGVAQPYTSVLRTVLAVAVPVLGAWWYCYRYAGRPASRLAAVVCAAVVTALLHVVPAHWVVGVGCLALLALLFDYVLRVAAARFPAMRAVGLVFLAIMALALLGHVIAEVLSSNGQADLHSWVRGGMRAFEYMLFGIVIWWAVAVVPFLLWFVFGQLAARDSDAARGSVATGRLGLMVSMASFVALSMAIWALLTTLVEFGAAGTSYCPLIFDVGTACFAKGSTFLHLRYLRSTETFVLAAGLTLALLLYMIVVLVPSVLAEVRSGVGTAQNLGRWLSGGYRRLEIVVTGLAATSVVVAAVVGVVLLLARCGILPKDLIGGAYIEWFGPVSEQVLKPLVLSAATAAAALSAFGGVLSRYVPWLRLPLDVALDVDNHFREFPRHAIPRARIFSRYVALLEHLVAQKYDRVVIVAHSQGTVISAELLRYLQHRAQWQADAGIDDRVTRLWPQLQGKIHLLTAGCPLRQLYAERFPLLYAWVGRTTAPGSSGPLASDVGANRWVNLYTTGDYVGRWLWCDPPPAVDTVGGHATLWNPAPAFTPMGGLQHDVCVGIGAHTHYFEQGGTYAARWIDALVS
ncbi:MAG TPA: hypothetical protein VF555_04040 [Variovorax sp.]